MTEFHGSLALANLLNSISLLQKTSRNCHHLLFLESENKSLACIINQTMQHNKLHDKQ